MLVIERGFYSPSRLTTVAHSAIRTNATTSTTSKYVYPFQKWSSGGYTTISQCKPRATALSIGSHKPRTTRKITMAWQDSTVRAEVDVPLSVAWELWSDREGLNRWMPWIASIKVSKDQPEMSRWTLKYNAFGQDLEFSWLARNMQPIQNQKIHWRSVDGLPNRGAVRFYPRGPSSCGIEVTVSYEVPEILAGAASVFFGSIGTGMEVYSLSKKIKNLGTSLGLLPKVRLEEGSGQPVNLVMSPPSVKFRHCKKNVTQENYSNARWPTRPLNINFYYSINDMIFPKSM